MTVYRVKLTDEAKVVKKIQAEVPEVAKYYRKHDKDLEAVSNKFSSWIDMGFKYEKEFLKMLAEARKGYAMADKKLKELSKDKKANKDKIADMLKMRKYFYDCGIAAKQNAAFCQPY